MIGWRSGLAAAVMVLGLGGAAHSAPEMLNGEQAKALLAGKRFNSEIWRGPGVLFLKTGAFRVGTRPACGKSDPHSYKINGLGMVTIEYRTCEGKKRHTMWFYVYRDGRAYTLEAAGGFQLHLRQR